MMKCNICGAQYLEFPLLFKAGNVHGRHVLGNEIFDVCQCPKCKTIFTDINTDSAYYAKYYGSDYYQDLDNNSILGKVLLFLKHLSFKRSLGLMRRFNPKAKKVLEIGCAKGDFLSWLPNSYEKFAVEINQNALKFVKEGCKDISILGERVEAVSPKNGKFDAILFFHVLEHVDNPDTFFSSLSNLLDKEGVTILEIPSSQSLGLRLTKTNWFHLDTPRHLYFYSYDSLKTLLDRYNLKIIYFCGNPIDYFHDLPVSVLKCAQTGNKFINIMFAIIILPVFLFVRLSVALFFPRFAEINTYVLKRKD